MSRRIEKNDLSFSKELGDIVLRVLIFCVWLVKISICLFVPPHPDSVILLLSPGTPAPRKL
jgi:hypothetical protein